MRAPMGGTFDAEGWNGLARIAEATGVAERTVSRILRRAGMPRLAVCDPLTGEVIRATKATAVRYEHDRPGSLIHIDVKKLGRIPDGGGWKAFGRAERPGHKRGLGSDYVHSAVDDHTRLAYSEILTNEKGTTCAGFLISGDGLLRQSRRPGCRPMPAQPPSRSRRRNVSSPSAHMPSPRADMTSPAVAPQGAIGTQARCVNGERSSNQLGHDSGGPSIVRR
jgi:hypothetical protein